MNLESRESSTTREKSLTGPRKNCTDCGDYLPLSKFRKDKHRVDGRMNKCANCKAKEEKRNSIKNPEIRKRINDKRVDNRKKYYSDEDRKLKYRNAQLIKAFNITLDQYNQILVSQDNVCYICRRDETSVRNRSLAVDHNHQTGKIRGLLCSNCNRALGLFKDNKNLLLAAAKYLEDKDEK